MSLWFALVTAAIGGTPVEPVHSDADVEALVALATAHPRIAQKEAELRFAHGALRETLYSPVQGLTLSSGLVEGNLPDSGPRVAGTAWLSVNVVDLLTYSPRIRMQRAEVVGAEHAVTVEARRLEVDVRQVWATLQELESTLVIAEQSVAMLSLQHEVAERQFHRKELEINELTGVFVALSAARVRRIQIQRAYVGALIELESLIGMPLSEALASHEVER